VPRHAWIVWRERGLYALAVLAILTFGLLPALPSTGPFRPDLIAAMSLAWVMRRPESATLPMIAGAGLLSDILLGRPLGLWSIFMIVGSEIMRGRETGKGLQMRLAEWGLVTALFAVLTVCNWLVLGLAAAPRVPAGQLAWHILATGLAYPPVVAALYFGLRIRAPQPADRSRRLARM
jgi:rod shape-determining protein MreD